MERQICNGENDSASPETGEFEDLSPAQHAGLLALLGSRTISGAARAANVPRRSLQRWLKEPAFKKALREARNLNVRQVSGYIQSASSLAAATLRKVMRDNKATAASRVSAARTTLELTFHLIEADEVAERLEVLEHLKFGGENGGDPGW